MPRRSLPIPDSSWPASAAGIHTGWPARPRSLGEVKPDVFCFCTPPGVRLPLIEIGIRSRAKLIAFEKPVALTSSEGLAIKQALDAAGVKAVVSHQHRYGEHYTKVKEIISSDEFGPYTTGFAGL